MKTGILRQLDEDQFFILDDRKQNPKNIIFRNVSVNFKLLTQHLNFRIRFDFVGEVYKVEYADNESVKIFDCRDAVIDRIDDKPVNDRVISPSSVFTRECIVLDIRNNNKVVIFCSLDGKIVSKGYFFGEVKRSMVCWFDSLKQGGKRAVVYPKKIQNRKIDESELCKEKQSGSLISDFTSDTTSQTSMSQRSINSQSQRSVHSISQQSNFSQKSIYSSSQLSVFNSSQSNSGSNKELNNTGSIGSPSCTEQSCTGSSKVLHCENDSFLSLSHKIPKTNRKCFKVIDIKSFNFKPHLQDKHGNWYRVILDDRLENSLKIKNQKVEILELADHNFCTIQWNNNEIAETAKEAILLNPFEKSSTKTGIIRYVAGRYSAFKNVGLARPTGWFYGAILKIRFFWPKI